LVHQSSPLSAILAPPVKVEVENVEVKAEEEEDLDLEAFVEIALRPFEEEVNQLEEVS
jgi:hypothetical protein